MRNLILTIGLLLTIDSYCTIDTITMSSKITDVTVFFSGAQVSRETSLKLKSGKHMLFFDQLPQEINPQSIQVKGVDGVTILSVKHQLNYKDQGKKTAEEKLVFENIEGLKFKMKLLSNQINVFEIEERIILDNSKVFQGSEGATVEKIEETANFYRLRLNQIRKGKLDLVKKIKDQENDLEDLYKKLNELTVKKRQTYSQLMIAIDCKKFTNASMTFSYYISSAGWEPLYDFRVKDISKPLTVVYNANVYQSSGEDWDKVNIILSSNNPMLSGSKPTMGSLYLGRGRQTQYRTAVQGTSAITGRVFESGSGEALPFSNVGIYRGKELIGATTTDFNGMYTIKPVPPGNYSIQVSYVGFQTKKIANVQLNNNAMALQDFALNPGVELQAVAIVEYKRPLFEKDQTTSGSTTTREEIERMAVRSVADIGKTTGNGVFSRDNYSGINVRGNRSGGSVTFIDGVKVIGSTQSVNNLISNSLKHGVTHLEYEIQIPYNIPSDGEDYNLKIKEVNLEVDYVYYAVPKLDKDAFLTAKLSDWNELNLLSGKTSIYYEGTFTSESFLDVDKADDTLSISLGRDKGIIISRVGNKDIYDKRKVGKNIKETVGWEIVVRNTKNIPINIIVEDQYPLSDRKSIEIELQENSMAKVDKKRAKLSWDVNLKAGEKKEISFSYDVTYPKYSNLAVE